MTHKIKLASLALLFSSTLLISCSKDDDPVSTDNTIAGKVIASGDFSTLEDAMNKANLQTTLRGSGPFTVFAPDNAAFAASGITATVLNSLTTQEASTILLYHTLAGEVNAASVPAGPNAKVITASGDSVFLTRNSSGVFINGVAVTQADIDASNGVIHKIGRVLLPPTGNLVETAQLPQNNLDSLVKAVLRVNNTPGGDPNLVAALQSGTLTVFAPTNAAFTGVLNALSLTDINDIPIATLTAVLKYHVVAGRAFSSDLANGQLTMLAGGNTTINLTNGAGGGSTITGSSNGANRSNIVATNIMASNGVVHVIDRVLLP